MVCVCEIDGGVEGGRERGEEENTAINTIWEDVLK